jgi:hypothetical protein
MISGVTSPSYTGYTGIQKLTEVKRFPIADLVPIDISKLPTAKLRGDRLINDLAAQAGAQGSAPTDTSTPQQPSRDASRTETLLTFAGRLLGLSSDQVHQLYRDRVAALTGAKAAVPSTPVADTPAAAQAPAAGPGSGMGGEWGWDPSGIHSEIKVNGVVVGRVYNSGVTEIHEPYEFLAKQLDLGGPAEAGLEGPDIASFRIGQIKEALKDQNVEIARASTAMTLAEWKASQMAGGGVDRLA